MINRYAGWTNVLRARIVHGLAHVGNDQTCMVERTRRTADERPCFIPCVARFVRQRAKPTVNATHVANELLATGDGKRYVTLAVDLPLELLEITSATKRPQPQACRD